MGIFLDETAEKLLILRSLSDSRYIEFMSAIRYIAGFVPNLYQKPARKLPEKFHKFV